MLFPSSPSHPKKSVSSITLFKFSSSFVAIIFNSSFVSSSKGSISSANVSSSIISDVTNSSITSSAIGSCIVTNVVTTITLTYIAAFNNFLTIKLPPFFLIQNFYLSLDIYCNIHGKWQHNIFFGIKCP